MVAMEVSRQVPTLEIAPGKHIAASKPSTSAPDDPPRYMLCEAVPLGAGTYRFVPRPVLEWMGLSQTALAKVGITLSGTTLRRLGRAGFIRVRPISPNRYEFNFASWLEHCRRVEADPEEFWDTPDVRGKTNRQRYLEAL